MKNIFLLPTKNGLPVQSILPHVTQYTQLNYINKNIYITSDEEIKERDWCMYLGLSMINFKVIEIDDYKLYHGSREFFNKNTCKKIILTTDQDLINNGVQAIDDGFLEWFVKNPSCEEVEIKYVKTPDGIFYNRDNVPYGYYKIIFSKEEPKLVNNCPKCGLDLIEREGSKPICTDIDCRGIILSNKTLKEWTSKQEPKQKTLENHYLSTPNSLIDISRMKLDNHPDLHKQETLEEAAERLIPDNFIKVSPKQKINASDILRHYFKDGAKWQAERMYNEEAIRFVSFVGKNYIKAKGFYYMKGDFEKKHKVSIHQIFEEFKNEK